MNQLEVARKCITNGRLDLSKVRIVRPGIRTLGICDGILNGHVEQIKARYERKSNAAAVAVRRCPTCKQEWGEDWQGNPGCVNPDCDRNVI